MALADRPHFFFVERIRGDWRDCFRTNTQPHFRYASTQTAPESASILHMNIVSSSDSEPHPAAQGQVAERLFIRSLLLDI
jgi:hypothetical protein